MQGYNGTNGLNGINGTGGAHPYKHIAPGPPKQFEATIDSSKVSATKPGLAANAYKIVSAITGGIMHIMRIVSS